MLYIVSSKLHMVKRGYFYDSVPYVIYNMIPVMCSVNSGCSTRMHSGSIHSIWAKNPYLQFCLHNDHRFLNNVSPLGDDKSHYCFLTSDSHVNHKRMRLWAVLLQMMRNKTFRPMLLRKSEVQCAWSDMIWRQLKDLCGKYLSIGQLGIDQNYLRIQLCVASFP